MLHNTNKNHELDTRFCDILVVVNTLVSEFKIGLIFLLLSIALFLLDSLGMLNPLRRVSNFTIAPVQIGIYQTGIKLKNQFDFIFTVKTATNENRALKKQLSGILIENASLRQELSKTKSLVAEQAIISPTTYNLLPATILGASRFVIIDQGLESGLKSGMPVIFKDSLIGQIKDVTQNRSTIILTSDPESKISSMVTTTQGKTKGILVGQFGQALLLDKILHQEPIAVGDLVYTEGIETILPKGLVLGTVSEVYSRDNEVFKQARVRPIFDAANLDLVFVITN